MTEETTKRINDMKNKWSDFDERIACSLIEFNQFRIDSGKNSNMNT